MDILAPGAAVGGQGMSEEDRQVCMVDDMATISPLAEAYARARGTHRLACGTCICFNRTRRRALLTKHQSLDSH